MEKREKRVITNSESKASAGADGTAPIAHSVNSVTAATKTIGFTQAPSFVAPHNYSVCLGAGDACSVTTDAFKNSVWKSSSQLPTDNKRGRT